MIDESSDIRFGDLRFRINSKGSRRFYKIMGSVVLLSNHFDFPLTPFYAREVLKACAADQRFATIAQNQQLKALAGQESEARCRAAVKDGYIYIALPYQAKDDLKENAVTSLKWNADIKAWYLPVSSVAAHSVVEALYQWGIYGDDAFKKLCQQQVDANAAKVATDLEQPTSINKQLWLHQLRAYHFARNMEASMLAMGMGTGKSLTTLCLAENAQLVLIFAPKHVMQVWVSEVQKHIDRDKRPKICLLNDRTVEQRIKHLKQALAITAATKERLFVVINYESVSANRTSDTARKKLQDLLLQQEWDYVIYDECHRLKTAGSKTSQFAAMLTKVSKKRTGLTGTPFHNIPPDIFAQFRALDPSVFGDNKNRFERKFVRKNIFNGYEGLENEEEFNRLFYQLAFRVTSDILDLPDSFSIPVYCDLEPKARKIYQDLDNTLVAQIANGELTVANAAVLLLRLLQLSGGWLKNDEGLFEQVSFAKANLLKELLQDFPKEEPLMITAYFSKDIETIHNICSEAGRTTSELSGKKDEYQDWLHGKTSTLVGQIKSASVGIDCTRTSAMILYSEGLVSPGDIDQLKRRILRPNQKNNVRFFYLLNSATRDVDVYRARQNKEEDIARIIMQRIREGHTGY